MTPTPGAIPNLSALAWAAHRKARVRSGIAVGCAVATDQGEVLSACNVEIPFRHGIHAEINALSSMKSSYPTRVAAMILIAAEKERFTPCGECMDWILALGSPDTDIIVESAYGERVLWQPARMFMPFYPR